MSNIVPDLVVLCGIQGSGKSTWAKSLLRLKRCNPSNEVVLLSSDSYREVHPTWDNNQIFTELYKDLNEALRQGKDVVLDSTATTRKSRRKIFNALKFDCRKVCIIMNTPYQKCVERVEARNLKSDRQVPIEVIQLYYEAFEIPMYSEGFDIILFNKGEIYNSQRNEARYLQIKASMDGFDQLSQWHAETLDKHAEMVTGYLIDQGIDDIALIEAATLHDIGKLKTQHPKIKNPKFMSYFNHANVGAYDLMCEPDIFTYPLDSLAYINYHMQIANAFKSPRAQERALKRYGNYHFERLCLLNKADQTGRIHRGEQ